MSKVIFSIYIDIPEDELDPQPPHYGDTEDKNLKAKTRVMHFINHFLERSQRAYAEHIGVDYRIFKYDDKWKEFKAHYNKKISNSSRAYNIVNFSIKYI